MGLPTRVLTIAGSDSGGGAGLQADLRVFGALGAYGTTVVTAVTAQDTSAVHGIHDVPAEMVRRQIRAVLDDIGADAVKTGLLGRGEIVCAVADELRGVLVGPLVVDPVLVATSGDALAEPQTVEAIRAALLPIATVVTPNLAEAAAITGLRVESVDDAEIAARALRELGATTVIVTGGHFEGSPIDVVYDGHRVERLAGKRIGTGEAHGTGCIFSAAIAVRLALGDDCFLASRFAKAFVEYALDNAISPGAGLPIPRPRGIRRPESN